MDKLRQRVHRLLVNRPETRKSYSVLCAMIWEQELHRINQPITQFIVIYGSPHYNNDISRAGSITRCARALVKEYPELGDKETQAKRHERAEAMRLQYSQRPSNPTRYNSLGGE
tara:strand:+ start:770 stop:1111 length:342 start_codon:yes stop_codon:yes gene_type:complete